MKKENSIKYKVLFISSYIPTPLKPRLLGFIRALSLTGIVELHLLHVDEPKHSSNPNKLQQKWYDGLKADGISIHKLKVNWIKSALWTLRGLLSGRSLRYSLYSEPGLAKQFHKICEEINPDIIHIDRLRTEPITRMMDFPKLIDLTDPLGLTSEWRSQNGSWWFRWLWFLDSVALWKNENSVASKMETIFASEYGKNIFQQRTNNMNCHCIGNPVILSSYEKINRQDKTIRICFSGNLNYWPNFQGIKNFLLNDWPVIIRNIDDIELTLLGYNPPRKLKSIAKSLDITIIANPIDIHNEMRKFDLSIAPLHYCGGFSNKIADAILGAGIPVLATEPLLIGLPKPVRILIPKIMSNDDLIDKLNEFKANPEKFYNLVKLARGAFHRELNMEICAQRLLEKYRIAIHKHKTAKNVSEEI